MYFLEILQAALVCNFIKKIILDTAVVAWKWSMWSEIRLLSVSVDRILLEAWYPLLLFINILHGPAVYKRDL